MLRPIIKRIVSSFLLVFSAFVFSSDFDLVIKNGLIYDGSGQPPYSADLAIKNDRIADIGDLSKASAIQTIDAKGMAVTPGFIDMLSWSVETLIADGKSQGAIHQGVTLEVFGEGLSMGPVSEALKEKFKVMQGDIKYDIEWSSLKEYLDFLVKRGVSTNVASFVGATTIRMNVLGEEDRAPTEAELNTMRQMVDQAMQEGALGVGASLIYAPAFYASTEELIELSKVAAKYNGMYVTHMRSEGNKILEAVDETLRIAKEANIRAEIYHLKASGKSNWPKLKTVFQKIENARKKGIDIAANMYTYPAGATGLDAAMPPWVQEGGHDKWVERLKDPEIRKRIIQEIKTDSDDWENLYIAAGDPSKLLFFSFKNEKLKHLTGKTLAEVAAMRKQSPEETMIDLVIEDDSRVGTVYFLMSEENVKEKIRQPWMTFGSDGTSMVPEGIFLKSSTHPRSYGNFSRLLGKYVRDEKVIPLAEAIRRLTSLSASRLKIKDRGSLKVGYFADINVFDPAKIKDHATFKNPHQLSTGMTHVFVNGTQVLKDGKHTGAKPGQVVLGPGFKNAN